MLKKIWISLFVVSILTLGVAYFYEDPVIRFQNLNRNEIFDLVVADFKKLEKPQREFSLSALPQFAMDRSLVDPAFALPHYYLYPKEISAFVKHESQCLNLKKADFKSLPAKFYTWLEYKCHKIEKLPAGFFESFPFMHPSGVSFAKLASSSEPKLAWHHILEIETGASDFYWALYHGMKVVVVENGVWISQQSVENRDSALTIYNVYSRLHFEKFVAGLGLESVKTNDTLTEIWPPSYLSISQKKKELTYLREKLIFISLLAIFGLLVGWLLRLLQLRIGEQKRRAFSFQLLGHELRTPVATLKIEAEELLRRYDELPQWAQIKTLRFVDSLDRLANVIKASDHYIQMQKRGSYLNQTSGKIESLSELLEKVSEAFDERVVINKKAEDCSLSVDSYWVSFCVSNLISNGLNHGVSPIVISWEKSKDVIRITVADQGDQLARDPRYTKRTSDKPGLGIGLAMVDRIVRELGGTLEFKAKPTLWLLSFKGKL